MELKNYQKRVIQNLCGYLRKYSDCLDARRAYENLDAAAKVLVVHYGRLEDAENALAAAKVVTVYYLAVPADYQTVWTALYRDEESYLASHEYTTYVAPLAAAVEGLTTVQRELLEGSDYWLMGLSDDPRSGIQTVLSWRPEPVQDTFDIQDVMAACRILARSNTGTEPADEELERYDLTEDGDIGIDDIMAICRQIAIKNQQQGA